MPTATNTRNNDVPLANKRAKLADGRTEDNVEYCPYTLTSQNYDTRRVNPGINIILGSMCTGNTPLHETKVLDIGCGTASFIEQIYKKVKSVDGVEYNDGMIEKAHKRFANCKTVKVVQGSAQALPYADNTFDAATINQVVHHFSNSNNYSEFKDSLAEAHRVLKPGGVLILNTSTPEQQRDAFWWLELFPEQTVRQCARFPPLDVIKQHTADVGLLYDANSVVVPLERPLMHPDLYLNEGYKLAFDETYRHCDSSWEMPPEELEAGLNKLRSMMEDKSVDTWLEQREAKRLSMGQATFVTVFKPQ